MAVDESYIQPVSTPSRVDTSPAAVPSGDVRYRRNPATGDEQARRKAWGKQWGSITRDAGLRAQEARKT